jgi:uncharacterized protein (DUF362 family)/Pyruvate/2-oxoacid:ferredoxin oxidoreductase delta subunit
MARAAKGTNMDDRIALVSCADYEVQQVEASVRRAVDLLGGMGCFVKSDQRVVVKPNLLLPSDPAKAIVTHPAVVRAVVLLVQEAGGAAIIADNPGVVPVRQRGWQSAYGKAGWAAVAEETGATLNMSIEAQQHPHPEGQLLKLVDTSGFATEADVLISVPKLKTHALMRYTGAVKNLFGTVPGATKFGYHAKLQSAEHFAEMLLDLVSFVRPALTVMDAVVGMDGDGPSGGEPFPIGAVLAGTDPVAVDVAALELVGQEPASVPTVAGAIDRGWTTGRVADLKMLGDGLAELQVDGFRMPAGGGVGMERLPGFLQQWATRQLVASPYVTEDCIGCKLCIENCPVQTIAHVDRRAQIELQDCIRCYCCHEICPEKAIELRLPWLNRTLAGLVR